MSKFPGLYGKECDSPKYFCKSKMLYLSEKDVAKKKCYQKPDFDMIGTKICPYISTVEEYKKVQQDFKERIQRAKNNLKAERNN